MKANFLFIFLIFIIIACEKKQVEPPIIEVFSPSENKNISVGDTLRVSAAITSPEKIKNIKIVLLKPNMTQACTPVTYYPNQNNFNINTDYEISNFDLETDQYFLYIEATNNSASTYKYIRLHISESKKQSKSLVVFCFEKEINGVDIYKIDSLFQTQLFKNINGDFANSAINSQKQIIYSMGRKSGNLYFIDAENAEVLDYIQAISTTTLPYFEELLYSNNLLLVSYYDGRISGFYPNGFKKFEHYFAHCRASTIMYDGKYIVALFKNISEQTASISVIFESSGIEKGKVFTNLDVKKFYKISEKEILAFCFNKTQPSICILDPDNLTFTKIKNLPLGEIFDVDKIDEDNYIFTHSEGVFIYSRIKNIFFKFYDTKIAEKITFDSYQNIVFLTNGKTISFIKYPNGDLIKQIHLPDTIRKMEILYNK